MISDMRAEGRSTEEIARAVSTRRNEIRMEAYRDDPVGLEKLKASNLAKYGNENGGTPATEAQAQSSQPSAPTAAPLATTAVPSSEPLRTSLSASRAKLKVSSKTLKKGRTYNIIVLKKNGQKVTFSVWDRKGKKKIKKNRISINSKGKIKVTVNAKKGTYIR